MTAINLSKSYLDGGMVAFDLAIDAPPRNFLGVATDIVFEGDFAAAGYRGMEWGALIAGMPESERPIQMVKALPDQSRVILGMTFRADRLPELSGGVLARLVFEKDILQPVAFEQRVISSYDGVRKDLSAVDWTISAGPLKGDTADIVAHKLPPSVRPAVGEGVIPAVVSDELSLQSNWEEVALMEVLNGSPEEAVPLPLPWFVWPWGVLVVMLMIGGWFYHSYGRRPIGPDLA